MLACRAEAVAKAGSQGDVIMKNKVTRVAAVVAVLTSAWLMQSPQAAGRQEASTPPEKTSRQIEQGMWALLDDGKSPFVSLAEADFRALGEEFNLPDGGRAVTELARQAPGGAFDPRDVAKIPPATLGYKADWIVERYSRYNLEWDITGLRLTSLDPNAKAYPWLFIINGGESYRESRRGNALTQATAAWA